MTRRRIFISSVQKELAQEREGLRDYLHADPLLRRFFDVFLFEDVPAADRSAERGYLKEVKQCDIFLGLFANDYGRENRQGLSSTELEFNAATEAGKTRLIYVKGANDRSKHPKMKALILRAGNELIRRRFDGVATLKPAVYASLVDYLEEERLISTAPFDASPCADAEMDDLDVEAMQAFIRLARHARNFPLPESTRPVKLLAHLICWWMTILPMRRCCCLAGSHNASFPHRKSSVLISMARKWQNQFHRIRLTKAPYFKWSIRPSTS